MICFSNTPCAIAETDVNFWSLWSFFNALDLLTRNLLSARWSVASSPRFLYSFLRLRIDLGLLEGLDLFDLRGEKGLLRMSNEGNDDGSKGAETRSQGETGRV